MQLFYCPDVLNDACYLNSEESKHCIKVLRKTEGDLINLIDGQGQFYEVVITIASQRKFPLIYKKLGVKKSPIIHFILPLHPQKTMIAWNGFWRKRLKLV